MLHLVGSFSMSYTMMHGSANIKYAIQYSYRIWYDHRTCGFNPSNTQLNPICHLLALLEAHHILHVSKIRVNKDSFK
jgi:hypothetical protein